MDFNTIICTKNKGYSIIEFNRPNALNALNSEVMSELISALEDCDNDKNVNCIILTGNEKSFAAGVDIKEMANLSTKEIENKNDLKNLDKIRKIKKPIIAAVSGFALGGGCEVAMACDIIIASESAKFGQPEISIGVIPGAGGTQRLTRAIGKSKAMEMILTGDFISAIEAKELGLVSKVVPNDKLLLEAKNIAEKISSKPQIAIKLAKETILKSYEVSLEEGLEIERKNFNSLFSTEDQKEGMKAFIEKRKPVWSGK